VTERRHASKRPHSLRRTPGAKPTTHPPNIAMPHPCRPYDTLARFLLLFMTHPVPVLVRDRRLLARARPAIRSLAVYPSTRRPFALAYSLPDTAYPRRVHSISALLSGRPARSARHSNVHELRRAAPPFRRNCARFGDRLAFRAASQSCRPPSPPTRENPRSVAGTHRLPPSTRRPSTSLLTHTLRRCRPATHRNLQTISRRAALGAPAPPNRDMPRRTRSLPASHTRLALNRVDAQCGPPSTLTRERCSDDRAVSAKRRWPYHRPSPLKPSTACSAAHPARCRRLHKLIDAKTHGAARATAGPPPGKRKTLPYSLLARFAAAIGCPRSPAVD